MEVIGLSTKLTADVAGFVSGMTQAMGAVGLTSARIREVQEAATRAAGAMRESGAAAAQSAQSQAAGFDISLRLAKQAFSAFKSLGAEMIADANEMDKAGAGRWKASLDGIRDSAKTLMGTLGRELRPVLEWLMDSGAKALQQLTRLDFGKMASDARYALGEVWSLLQDLGAKAGKWGESLGRLLLWPFQAMQDAINKALVYAMGKMAEAADMAKRLGLGEGGDRFRAAAQAAQTAGSPDIYSQVTGAMEEGAKDLAGALVGGLGQYVKDKPVETHHFADKEELEERKRLAREQADEDKRIARENLEASKRFEKEAADFAKDQVKGHAEEQKALDKEVAEARKRSEKEFAEYRKKLDEEERRHAKELQDFGKGIVGQFTGALGPTGSLVNGAVAGMTVGGPGLAIAAVASQLLTSSATFKGISENLNKVVQELADTVGQLLHPILQASHTAVQMAPALEALGPALQLAGRSLIDATPVGIFVDLAIMWGPVVDAVRPIADILGYLGAGFGRMQAAFHPFQDAVQELTKVVDSVFGPSVRKVGNLLELIGIEFEAGLGGVIRATIDAMQPLIELLGSPLLLALKGMFYGAKFAAEGALQVAIILGDIWDGALNLLQRAIQSSAVAALGVADAIGSVWNIVLEGMAGAVSELRNATGGNNSPFADALKGLFQQLVGDPNNPNDHGMLANTAPIQQAMADASASLNQMGVDTGPLHDALAALQNITWDTADASQHLANQTERAAQAMEQLSNVPAGYRVELERFKATVAGAPPSQSGGGAPPPPPPPGEGGVTVYGDIYVLAEDAESLRRSLERGNFIRTGTPVGTGQPGVTRGRFS